MERRTQNKKPLADKPILVVGATGTVGGEVVRLLAVAGAEVRAFTRNEPKARTTFADLDIEYAVGDLAEPASVARAAKGCGQLFLLTQDGHGQVEQAVGAAAAAAGEGVEHIVKLSSSNTGRAPFAWAKEHYEIEQQIETLGVGFTHLRPHYFMQNLLGTVHLEEDTVWLQLPMGAGRMSPIDVRDIASCAAAVLLAGRPLGRAAVLTGGESFTMEEAASALSEASGVTVRYRDIDPQIHLQGMLRNGVDREQAESVSLMYEWGREGKLDWITKEVESITGQPPRSLSEFAAEVAGPMLHERFG